MSLVCVWGQVIEFISWKSCGISCDLFKSFHVIYTMVSPLWNSLLLCIPGQLILRSALLPFCCIHFSPHLLRGGCRWLDSLSVHQLTQAFDGVGKMALHWILEVVLSLLQFVSLSKRLEDTKVISIPLVLSVSEFMIGVLPGQQEPCGHSLMLVWNHLPSLPFLLPLRPQAVGAWLGFLRGFAMGWWEFGVKPPMD